jgi:uncharacterized membrane protein YdjX (TVP38/TMEM64 family)
MKRLIIGILILSASAALYFLWKKHVFDHFTVSRIEAFLLQFGRFAPLVYIALLAISVVVSQIPNIPLAIAAGMLFGTFYGGLYSIIGGMLGSLACFTIARFLGVAFLKKIFGKIPMFTDQCKDTHLGLLIFLTRLIPFFSFDLISYCSGFTNIRTRTFLLATLLGMTPMTFLFAHLGGVIMVQSSATLILNGVMLAVFLLVPFLVYKYNIFNLNKYIEFK